MGKNTLGLLCDEHEFGCLACTATSHKPNTFEHDTIRQCINVLTNGMGNIYLLECRLLENAICSVHTPTHSQDLS